jgi:hypothetical protein
VEILEVQKILNTWSWKMWRCGEFGDTEMLNTNIRRCGDT